MLPWSMSRKTSAAASISDGLLAGGSAAVNVAAPKALWRQAIA